MSPRITFEGKSVEDAVEEACRRLGRPLSEGEYRVLENRKGFWGMNRKVVIDLEAPEGYVDTTDRAAGSPDGASGDSSFRSPRGPVSSGDAVDIAKTIVHDIVQGIGLTVELRVEQESEAIRVQLSGPDESKLTDRQGELLSAIQYLAGKVISRRIGPDCRIEVDAGGFRERRAMELAALAQRTASAVRESGKKALLPPMTPAERRQIHVALAEDPDVTTESEGDGFKKRVAVFLKNRNS